MKKQDFNERYCMDRRKTGQLAIGSGSIGNNGEGFKISPGVSPDWKRKLRENTQFGQKTDILALPKEARAAYEKWKLNEVRIEKKKAEIAKATKELAEFERNKSSLYSNYLKLKNKG